MVLTLDDVLFNSDQAQLKPAGLRLVDQLTMVLKEHPHRTVTIEGITDSTGTEAHNLALSSQRADMVGTPCIITKRNVMNNAFRLSGWI